MSMDAGSRALGPPRLTALAGGGESLVLDTEAINEGSGAAWGYRYGDATGEVFLYPIGAGMTVLEVIPSDGENRPTVVDVPDFSHSDEEALLVIGLALQHRARERFNR
jgi:hypothetical protein